jgi:hypothetical protein
MTQLPFQVASRDLARASIAATAGAAAILCLFVLPAEWGIDPTGVGKALGLTRMADADADADDGPDDAATSMPPAPAAAVPIQSRDTILASAALRSDRKTLVLAPHSGHEVKAHMRQGDHLVFRWTSSAPVRMDMHGEPAHGKADDFTSYWKQKDLTEAQGQFTAPFDGTHGWYWRNGGEVAATLEVETTGFYQDLFEPPGE